MTPRRRSAIVLGACAAMLLGLEVAALVVQRDWQRERFVSLALGQGAVYAIAAIAVWTDRTRTVSLAFVLLVAALLRAGPLAAPVIWTSDINRYVWDGRVQRAGFNPYCCVPSDARLASVRDDTVYPQINRRDSAHTIYPPLAQMLFAAGASSVASMKLLMVLLEAVGIAAMIALLVRTGHAPALVLLYAWHPLAIWEIAGSGHLEGAMVAFVSLALLAFVAGRRALAGVALAMAAVVKLIPIALVPALWRRGDRRVPLALAATVVAAYLPYLGAGWNVLGYLPGYVDEEKLAPSSAQGYWLVDALRSAFAIELPGIVYVSGVAALLGAIAIAAMSRERSPQQVLRWAMALGVAAVVAMSPHYAWYFVLPVALATISPWPPALWPGLVAFVLYWDPEGGRIPIWAGALIYGGFACAAIGWAAWRHAEGARGAWDVDRRAA